MIAYPLVYSYQHRYFADGRLARSLWPRIQSYVGFLQNVAKHGKSGLVTWHRYGDWLQPGRRESEDIIGEMSSAFSFVLALRIARDTAHALGYSRPASSYAK